MPTACSYRLGHVRCPEALHVRLNLAEEGKSGAAALFRVRGRCEVNESTEQQCEREDLSTRDGKRRLQLARDAP
eukprot:scaffold6541_cov30-Tisochrysis_lutea.AAC.3